MSATLTTQRWVVRDVVGPRGYHPNVAPPGGSIAFLWMTAAHLAAGGSGRDPGRAQ